MDKEHFYKIDGELMLLLQNIAIKADNGEISTLLVDIGQLTEKIRNLKLEKIE